jgi:hypothetical protein
MMCEIPGARNRQSWKRYQVGRFWKITFDDCEQTRVHSLALLDLFLPSSRKQSDRHETISATLLRSFIEFFNQSRATEESQRRDHQEELLQIHCQSCGLDRWCKFYANWNLWLCYNCANNSESRIRDAIDWERGMP